ncbi:MAG: hypothetical protein ACPGJH_05030 [Alphaproteobacteria bacterium]
MARQQIQKPFSEQRHRLHVMRAQKITSEARFLLQDIFEAWQLKLALLDRPFVSALELSAMPPMAESLGIDAPHVQHISALEGSYDLIMAPLLLDVANDPAMALRRCWEHLQPDGVLLTACLGEDNLRDFVQAVMHTEMSQSQGAAARFHPRISLQDIAGLALHVGFTNPVVDKDQLSVRYQHLHSFAKDMRAHGLQNSLTDIRPLTKTLLNEINEKLLGPQSTPLRFEILHLTAFRGS